MKLNKLFFTIILVLAFNKLWSQESPTAINAEPKNADQTKILITGFGYAGFAKQDKEISNFGPIGFNPIFLWKKSDKLFFESELSIELADGQTKFDLEYAVLHYKLCDYLDLAAGKFLSPFGIFNERIHPSWVNKFADHPLGFNHDIGTMVGPMSEFGVEFGGGAQLGSTKINYVFYVSNGPTLKTDTMMAGMLMYENINDNNDNKAFGGRIGFLPFKNSCLEIGVSAQTAVVGDQNNVLYNNIGAQLAAFDLSFIHKLDFIKSNIDIKGQFNMVNVDKAVKYPTNMLGMDSTFDNHSQALFVQMAIRPVYIDNNFIKNLELAGRYSSMSLPEKAMWGGDYSQITIGINYWLSWHSVIKLDYQINYQKGTDSKTGFLVQWGMGF